MNTYSLKFQGYTWDDYFFMIADKQGLLIIYSGMLDDEGIPTMKEILYVGWMKELSNIYSCGIIESICKKKPRNRLLFFSYAEIDKEMGALFADVITGKKKYAKEMFTCEGACALLPNEMLKGL